nr:MAG TPA: hypothetical protein [Myoviridae sp. ctfuG5]
MKKLKQIYHRIAETITVDFSTSLPYAILQLVALALFFIIIGLFGSFCYKLITILL